ncbi:putative receptor-like protein kinase [Platanthera zijinensis]|uniref:Receptor-like protein kinase n=1 Tax=Platanthera zijinensis TaxID=2320716 RepID=A0AAP0AZR5_9ASPA
MGCLAIHKGKEEINFTHKPRRIHSLAEPKREKSFPNPHPLPLPSPMSFRSSSNNGPLLTSMPLPLPPLAPATHTFSLEETSVSCQHFSFDQCTSEGLSTAICGASFGDDSVALKKTIFDFSAVGSRRFVNQLNLIACLKHPCLCEIIGFHVREGVTIVYEGLFHGSFDNILHGRSNLPSLDWNARMKIALCAAEGLAFLHEEGPFQAMYSDFSSTNIQVSKDFSAKLSGYGCVDHNLENEYSKTRPAEAKERRKSITPMSNVRSFGVVLVELLTGRKDSNTCYAKNRDIVQWSKPFLADESRLSLIMDPHLQGRFPCKAAQIVAKIALRSLHRDPSERPTMREVVWCIKSAHSIKYSCLFPLREPPSVKGQPAQSLSCQNSLKN